MMAVMTPAMRHKVEDRPAMLASRAMTVIAVPTHLVPAMGIHAMATRMFKPGDRPVMATILPLFGTGARRGEGKCRDCDGCGSQKHASV